MAIFTEDERVGLQRYSELVEASEVDVSTLTTDRFKLAQYFGKPVAVWDGIHGLIVDIELKSTMGSRFSRKMLARLLANKNFRWVEYDAGTLSIGF